MTILLDSVVLCMSVLISAACGCAVHAQGSPSLGMHRDSEPWVVYAGQDGPGQGKHIVFVTGDEEYRSEEGMPQLARILATRHGFRCTVVCD